MGADAAVERHDGTPPGEDQITARMRAEGLSPHGWGNGPGDTYGWHEHGYEKVLYCVRGQIVFHTAGGDIELGPETRWSSRRTPRTRQRSAPRACAASKRLASETRARLTGSATWQDVPDDLSRSGHPSSRLAGILSPGLRCINIQAWRPRVESTAGLQGCGHREDASDNRAPTRRSGGNRGRTATVAAAYNGRL
jgi:hypothetical protein